jgi:uncharacterized protein YcbX
MRLDQIWRYPVKSMLGARVESAELADNGVVGDRMWALRDEERGAIASGRKIAGVTRLAAAIDADGTSLVITLPDGDTVTSADTDADDRISSAVDHRVSLWSKQPADNEDHYRRGRPDNDDVLTELRFVFGRLDDEPLPDFSIFPPEMREFEYPPGNYFDCYPLMIMTTSALGALRAALPDSAIDERRFRPSLVINTGNLEGHPEFEWTGRRLRIGGTTVEIGAKCPRCTMVTRQFAADLPADRRVLRHIVRDLDQNVGVYATVMSGGPIRVGDSVELV